MGQAAILHAQHRGHVPHRVEGAIVGDDLDQVAGPGAAEPDPRAHRDAQVAPVLHAGGGRAVDELGAAPGEEPRAVGADDPPVADRDQVHAAVGAVDREMVEHPADVVGAARVLHVHEDRRAARSAAAAAARAGCTRPAKARSGVAVRTASAVVSGSAGCAGGVAARLRVGLLVLLLTGVRARLGVERFFFAMADEPSTSSRGAVGRNPRATVYASIRPRTAPSTASIRRPRTVATVGATSRLLIAPRATSRRIPAPAARKKAALSP